MAKDQTKLSPHQRREIRFWLDFMYAKIKRMSHDDLVKLLASINHRINPDRLLRDVEWFLRAVAEPEESLRERLREMQNKLRDLFELLMLKARNPELEKELRRRLEAEGGFLDVKADQHYGYEWFAESFSPRKARVYAKEGRIYLSPDPSDFSLDLIIHHFFSISNPLDPDIFSQCEYCGRYLFPLRGGKRATRYCSKACAWNAWHKKAEVSNGSNSQTQQRKEE